MTRRILALALALLLMAPAFLVSSYAIGSDPTPTATFTKDLSPARDPMYMGTNPSWPYDVELTFTNEADIGTVTYQWFRAVGDETDPAFDGVFEPYSVTDHYGGKDYPTFGTATRISDTNKFTIPLFYRDLSEPGLYTYYVKFFNDKDGVVTTFESTHRVTSVAPQVLEVKQQSGDGATTNYYFAGAAAQELSVTLAPQIPGSPEFDEENYREIRYQWYKSSIPSWDFAHDYFPYFDEGITPHIPGASGTITYADATDGDGATVTYTPVNDEVGTYYYWLLVYTDVNDVMSLSWDVENDVIQVLPAPVTSINRTSSGATVNINVVLPPDRTAENAFDYLIVKQGVDPGTSPYTTGALSDGAATLTFDNLDADAYDLYLVFKDDQTKDWLYKTSIPAYAVYYPPDGDDLDAGTTDGQIIAKGTIVSTDTGTITTVTGSSFTQMAGQSQQTGGGVRINTKKAVVTFDNSAVQHINGVAASGEVVIETALVDKSKLSAENQAVVGNRPVYDFTLTAGGTQVSSFNGGTAKISIPYTLAPGEQPEAVVVYYIDDSGKLITVKGSYNTATQTVDFTVSHFSYYAIGYNAVSFADVSAGDWYYDATMFIAARGITKGVDSTHFAPNAAMTRGQFITLLMRAYGINPDENPADNYADAGNSYYTGYLAAAKRLGITQGIGDNLFGPERGITRQDMFTLIHRALSVLGELPAATGSPDLSAFTDGGAVADYAQNALKALVAADIVKGSGGLLRPADLATRAEMAVTLYALLSA